MKATLKQAKKWKKEQTKKGEKAFSITSVCRVDAQSIGFDTSGLDDRDMENIASKISDSIMETFWVALETILIDVYKLKQHDM